MIRDVTERTVADVIDFLVEQDVVGSVRLNVSYHVFEHFRAEWGDIAYLKEQKCACADCGHLVLILGVAYGSEDADESDDAEDEDGEGGALVVVELVRSATPAETTAILERWADASEAPDGDPMGNDAFGV